MKKEDLEQIERLIMNLRREWDRIEGLERRGWKVAATLPITGERIEHSIPAEMQSELKASLNKKFGDLAKKILEVDWSKLEV